MSATKTLLETTITEWEEHFEFLIRQREQSIKNLADTENKITEALTGIDDLKNNLANMKH